MDIKTNTFFLILVALANISLTGGCSEAIASKSPETAEPIKDVNPTELILKKLNQSAKSLKSYQSSVEYLFEQPVFESKTLRKGDLYYQKRDDNSSLLLIGFQTLKQDDNKEQKNIEKYFFDGVWLTHIDYPLKQLKSYQQTEPNKPVDVFELVKQRFPLIGFSPAEDLKKEFEIELIEPQKTAEFIQLQLKVKPESVYKDDYTTIDFRIDKKTFLPARITAVTTEDEIYDIKLFGAKVNEKIAKDAFKIKITSDFEKEIIPLKKGN